MESTGRTAVSDPKPEISVDLELSIGVGPKPAALRGSNGSGAAHKHGLRTLRRMEARLRQDDRKRKGLHSVMQTMDAEEAAWFVNENLNYQDQEVQVAEPNRATYAMPVVIPYLPAMGRFGLPCMVPCWAPVVAAAEADDGVILPVSLEDLMPFVDNVGISGGDVYGRVPAYPEASTGRSLSGITDDYGSTLQGGGGGGGGGSSSSSTKMCSNSTQPEPERKLGKMSQVTSDKSISFGTAAPSPLTETKQEPFHAKPGLKTLDDIVFTGNKPAAESSSKKVPVVATKGNGPNGTTVYGYLYRCKKRNNELGIVCACHKRSFSAAEFVKHSGGGETVNPLKRIVVVKPGA